MRERDLQFPSAVDADMGWRFETGDWRRADGNIQSLLFYHKLAHILLDNNTLPSQVGEDRYVSMVWHDYGCAEGDGVALLQMFYPMMQLTGFDISTTAVDNAARRWPTLKFAVGDVRDPQEEAHIISSLHTLEHLKDPISAVRKLYDKAETALILVLPDITDEEEGGHLGAMKTVDFDAALHDMFTVIFKARFTTQRRYIGSTEFDILNEHSNLWIIR